jgi:pyruvate dehydrogenase E2 component (dihydrolipoamide acetyltransferase)
MAEVILMPRLSDTMTEGVIAAWHKKVGDPVKKGELLAEIETDKATMELESYKDGVILHIGTAPGGKLKVDDLLAIVGQAGEDISAYLQPAPAPVATPEAASTAPDPVKPATELEEVVLMPRLSDTMEAGVIAAWHKSVGDPVKKGDILAEIETDKATMELESYKNGTLLHVGAAQGEKIPVNGLLCIIGEPGKVDLPALLASIKGGGSPPAAPAEKTPPQKPVSVSSPAPTQTQAPLNVPQLQGRMKASPLAKKLARERGIDLGSVSGSGDGGRITKADIDQYRPTIQIPAPAMVTGEEGYTDIPNSQMRNVIARRLTESKFTAPHFYLQMEVTMDPAMSFRSQLNEFSPAKISFNDLVVKAVALSLRQHPAVNASWMGHAIRRYHHVHIGIAVAVEDGLIVPVVRFADQKGLPQIAAESKELSGKARSKKLQPAEFTGNTFTISNLGMMDIDSFTAIINPPDSCILAVGKIRQTVVPNGNAFAVAHVLKLTLSCDHRSVDGATGAAFLQTVKKYLENPAGLML